MDTDSSLARLHQVPHLRCESLNGVILSMLFGILLFEGKAAIQRHGRTAIDSASSCIVVSFRD